MTILFYLNILLPFAALFALGYFPTVLLGRQWAGDRPVGTPDVFAPIAGVVGTAVGYLFAGLNGYDRFALAPERVRTAWMYSGLSFLYELFMGLRVTESTLPGRHWLSFMDASYELIAEGGQTRIVRHTTIGTRLYPRGYWRPLERWGVTSEHEFVFSNLHRWSEAQ